MIISPIDERPEELPALQLTSGWVDVDLEAAVGGDDAVVVVVVEVGDVVAVHVVEPQLLQSHRNLAGRARDCVNSVIIASVACCVFDCQLYMFHWNLAPVGEVSRVPVIIQKEFPINSRNSWKLSNWILTGNSKYALKCNSLSHLTWRPVRPAVEEDDAVRVFAAQHGHDRPRPNFDALLLQKNKAFFTVGEAVRSTCGNSHDEEDNIFHPSLLQTIL